MLGDNEVRRKMGERNRQMVMKEYNRDTEMSRIESEYKRLAGKPEN
jgi:glycosyltransferase involved in cell wall biosynthesis